MPMTEEVARQLITRLLGTGNPVAVFPFEFGWAAQETLSPQDRAQGRHLGQGVFIIDQTGVVTAHPSLPPPLVMKRYAAARREGRVTGRQVWPKLVQTARALLLPVGLFFGTFHPVAGSTECYHRVRVGDEVWELDDQRFTLWALAHGAGDQPAEEPWTLPAVREAAAARLPGVDSTPLLHGLLAEGLAVEVVPGAGEAVEFARRHRVGARMLGLGNSAEKPWLWSIGFHGHPVVSVTRTVYDLWERCPSGESLWTMCQALADEEREAGGTELDLIDPERLLTAFLCTAHPLLAASVIYLEPLP